MWWIILVHVSLHVGRFTRNSRTLWSPRHVITLFWEITWFNKPRPQVSPRLFHTVLIVKLKSFRACLGVSLLCSWALPRTSSKKTFEEWRVCWYIFFRICVILIVLPIEIFHRFVFDAHNRLDLYGWHCRTLCKLCLTFRWKKDVWCYADELRPYTLFFVYQAPFS